MQSKVFNEKLKIRGSGSPEALEAAQEMLDRLNLTGNEGKDRLAIQTALEAPENARASKCSILYDGNGIAPYASIIKEYKRMLKVRSLSCMTKNFYDFCHVTLSDIAHYDKSGYIAYYNDDPMKLTVEFLMREKNRIPGWRTDAQRTLNALLEIAGL